MNVKLISGTEYPVETIYVEWLQSRTDDPVNSPRWYHNAAAAKTDRGTKLRAEIDAVFAQVTAMKMPLLETLDFVFLLEDVSIALREQLVRHRIGHKFGGRLGADLIPDIAGGSSFWSQSMRVKDMSNFAANGNFETPASVANAHDIKCEGSGMSCWKTASLAYADAMKFAADTYAALLQAGVPPEDARMVIPLGATHRMSWKVNLAALAHVLSKRGCWIAQLGLWKPLIHGVVAALGEIHPSFRRLIDPPCFADGHYTGCAYGFENWNRMNGEDPGVPCSLWCCNDGPGDYMHYEDASATERQKGIYRAMMKDYGVLWQRDPRTGEADYEPDLSPQT